MIHSEPSSTLVSTLPVAPQNPIPAVDPSLTARPEVARARRIVLKLGTRVLTEDDGELASQCIATLVATAAALVLSGRQVILVSSGAVGAGRLHLSQPSTYPSDHLRQACAAVGQARLTALYRQAFAPFGLTCGQLLVSPRDFDRRLRAPRLSAALTTLAHYSVVPILNENDALGAGRGRTVAFQENDRLAALIARQVDADLMVLLTDVDGLFDHDPRHHPGARLLSRVDDLAALPPLPPAAASTVSRGGMHSKLDAVRLAWEAGCSAVIANGRQHGALSHLVAGDEVGTWFPAPARSSIGGPHHA